MMNPYKNIIYMINKNAKNLTTHRYIGWLYQYMLSDKLQN